MSEVIRNALGGDLQACGLDPKTGFFRDGSCRTQANDRGRHVVCAEVTEEFLTFSRSRGNDLITPRPAFDFPGLKAGDRWCLCALRWREAHDAGVAPPIYLRASHERLLEIVDLDILLPYAKDLPQNS